MYLVSLLLFILTVGLLPLPPALAVDTIFDTNLSGLKDFLHFFCPTCIRPAEVSAVKEGKPDKIQIIRTKQIKTALAAAEAAKLAGKTRKSCCFSGCCGDCCRSIRNCLLKTALFVGFYGGAILFGFAHGEHKRQLGPSIEVTPTEGSVAQTVRVVITPHKKLNNNNREIWVHYKPYYVKIINLWEAIEATFSSNSLVFISEAVLIAFGLCLLTYYLIRSRKRRVKKGQLLTVDGVQCGLLEKSGAERGGRGGRGSNEERQLERKKVGWRRREVRVLRQKMPKTTNRWSGFSQFFSSKWNSDQVKKKRMSGRMKRGTNLAQQVRKWTPKRKVVASSALSSGTPVAKVSDHSTVLLNSNPKSQNRASSFL